MASPNRVVARYVYQDANGAPVFQVRRYEPKDFRQFHRNGTGWKAGRNGTPDLLYHLPEVIGAVERSDPIVITEGEKDTDAVRGLGFTATTNPGGAGKWRDELSAYLRGANVLIIYDNDPAGHQTRAQSRRACAASARTSASVGRGRATTCRTIWQRGTRCRSWSSERRWSKRPSRSPTRRLPTTTDTYRPCIS